MSSWANVTIEPKKDIDSKEKKILDRIRSRVDEIDCVDDIEEIIRDLEALKDFYDFDEIDAFINRYWERKTVRGASHNIEDQPRTAQFIEWKDRQDSLEIAEKIFRDLDIANRVLVISISNTVEAGTGYLFRRGEDDNAVFVDSKEGYEQAEGHDVYGYFREHYEVKGSTRR